MKFKIGFAIAAVVSLGVAPMASAHNTGFAHTHQTNSNNGGQQLAGGLIGAAFGSAIGSQFGFRNGNRGQNALFGALAGGVAGAAIAGNNNNFGGNRRFVGGSGFNGGFVNGGSYYGQPYYCLLYTSPSPRDRG